MPFQDFELPEQPQIYHTVFVLIEFVFPASNSDANVGDSP